jgi:POT family proton-dependent oligopeptide transporter
LAIGLLLVGVGCFKGNIASQVGELYDRDDLRRATAFQVFQFSITSAVIVSPLVCGTLGEKVGWHFGFGAAGVGMLLGLAMYLHGRPWLPAEIRATGGPARRSLSAGDWKVLALLIALLPLIAGAMVGNQQMFNAFVVWGEANFDMHLLGYEMPVTWLLSADAVISALCILASIAFWRAFATRWKEPGDLTKIAVGAAIMALAPLLLSMAGLRQQTTGSRISIGWGLAFELVNEAGFAMLVPVALSFYSRVAPQALQGVTIAMFYLNTFLCNLVVGRLGGLLEQMPATRFWLMHAAIVGVSAGLLVMVAYWGQHRFLPASG